MADGVVLHGAIVQDKAKSSGAAIEGEDEAYCLTVASSLH